MPTVSEILQMKAVRWTLLSLAGLGGLALVAIAVIYVVSAWILSTPHDVAPLTLRSQQTGSAERGARLAAVFGCTDCHESHGRVLFDAFGPLGGRVVPPDLARKQRSYTDAELVTLLRRGIKRDGFTMIEMPTNAYSSMADDDLVDVIAWLRSLQPDPQTETAQHYLGPGLRLMLLSGNVRISSRCVLDPDPPLSAPKSQHELGEYLAKLSCTNCHYLEDWKYMSPGRDSPGLYEATHGYDLAQFTRLMREGKGANVEDLGLMSRASRISFRNFTDEEVGALYAFLKTPERNAGRFDVHGHDPCQGWFGPLSHR
jgi:cytochrome c553